MNQPPKIGDHVLGKDTGSSIGEEVCLETWHAMQLSRWTEGVESCVCPLEDMAEH